MSGETGQIQYDVENKYAMVRKLNCVAASGEQDGVLLLFQSADRLQRLLPTESVALASSKGILNLAPTAAIFIGFHCLAESGSNMVGQRPVQTIKGKHPRYWIRIYKTIS